MSAAFPYGGMKLPPLAQQYYDKQCAFFGRPSEAIDWYALSRAAEVKDEHKILMHLWKSWKGNFPMTDRYFMENSVKCRVMYEQ